MTQYIDNYPMLQTFIRGETLAVKYADVYISDSMTVKQADTLSRFCIGNVEDGSLTQAAGTPVKINMYYPIRKGIAGAALAAGGKLTRQTATTPMTFISMGAGTNSMVMHAGFAVTSAPSVGSVFSFIPFYQAATLA